MRSLRQLQIFTEVVDREGFAASARSLKMTTAAVSKQITALEAELGIKLLLRTTRMLELTPEGQLYYEHCKQILQAVIRAEAEISTSCQEPSGSLKVICGPHFGSTFVIPHMNEFLDRYPKVKLNILFTQEIPDLEKEKIDLVLGLSASIPYNTIKRSLMKARRVICATPAYLQKYGTPKNPSDLVNHRLIAHSSAIYGNEISFKEERVQFDPILYCNDTRMIKMSALASIGMAYLHDYIISDELKRGELVEVLDPFMDKNHFETLYLAYPQTKLLHIKVRRFIDFILEKMNQ